MAVMSHVDRIDEVARAIGAVNALWWDAGTLVGGNTDALGFIGNLDVTLPGWDAGGGVAVILGGGGAARAAAYGLKTLGFAVALCNRTVAKAEKLAGELGQGVTAHGVDELATLLPVAELLVNATSLGMVGQPPMRIDLSPMKP